MRALPGVGQLLPALGDLPPVYLVGGAVRVLLGIDERLPSIDLAVEGDAREAARTIAARLGGDAREYEQFGTATVRTPRLEFDLATTRRETYPEPGALPRVEPAPLAEDLARRDFTVNAMAVGLRGDDLGHLYDPLGGVADAESRVIRVLHEGSFLDDPTRLLRAVRFETRLGFRMDEETERAARDAVAAGALGTVSGARIRDELLDLLAELEAPSAVARLGELGIDAGLHPALRPDPELVASAALGAVAIEADRALAALAALCAAAPQELDLWLDGLQLDARDRDVVSRAARTARPLAAELRSREHAPSELRAVLAGEPRERWRWRSRRARRPSRSCAGSPTSRTCASRSPAPTCSRPACPRARRSARRWTRRSTGSSTGSSRGREEELEAALALARDA